MHPTVDPATFFLDVYARMSSPLLQNPSVCPCGHWQAQQCIQAPLRHRAAVVWLDESQGRFFSFSSSSSFFFFFFFCRHGGGGGVPAPPPPWIRHCNGNHQWVLTKNQTLQARLGGFEREKNIYILRTQQCSTYCALRAKAFKRQSFFFFFFFFLTSQTWIRSLKISDTWLSATSTWACSSTDKHTQGSMARKSHTKINKPSIFEGTLAQACVTLVAGLPKKLEIL